MEMYTVSSLTTASCICWSYALSHLLSDWGSAIFGFVSLQSLGAVAFLVVIAFDMNWHLSQIFPLNGKKPS